MRILSVSSAVPHPPNHGTRIRTWNLLCRVARNADVTHVTWVMPGTPQSDLDAIASTVKESILIPLRQLPDTLIQRLRRQAGFLAGGPPPFVQAMLAERGGFTGEERRRFLEPLLRSHERRRFDVTVIEDDAMGCLPIGRLATPRVVHRLEIFTRLIGDLRRSSAAGRLLWPLESRAWRRFDKKLTAGATLAVATTPETAAELQRIAPSTSVIVVLNGVDVPALEALPASSGDLAFVGSMDYGPNEDAVCHFARNVWPEIAKLFPASRFRIVGRGPSARVRALQGQGIEVVGEVADVPEAFRGVRIGVVPLRAGIGIRNKTLEMMAMGLPVVTSRVGAAGLGASTDNGLIVAEGRSEFVARIADLMRDDVEVARMGKAARAYVSKYHSWDAIALDYLRALESVVEESRRPSRVE